ncbi:MAG TPA: glycosyltransferase [Methanomassiliicoccales archaeon]|nr:glycosyltransferase [Methanomassiliicoccales archaeon]
METKRIIMTSTFYPPYHLGGDATHVRALREELQRQGHEVHVLHSLDAYRWKRGEVAGEPEAQPGIHTVQGRLGKWSAVGTYLSGRNRAAERELERLVKEVRPNWVHHHNVSLLGAGVLRERDVPSVYTAHDYWLICPRSDLMYLARETCTKRRCTLCSLATRRPPQVWRYWGMRGALSSIDLAIAPSRFMAGQLRSFLGIEAEVLPNFAAAPDHAPKKPEGYFAFVGVLEKNKGLDLLLEAFKERAGPGLHVMGRGTLEPLVREAELATSGRISYKGFLEGRALWEEMSGSQALVCPSTGNENSPLACIEALALGVPLVVSSKGGLPELVQDPECGTVASLDARGLAKALAIMSDPVAREQLARNAFIKYQANHQPGGYVDRYLRLCEEMELEFA